MANKKIIMSVTASAAIASAIFAADEVEAASYKVQSGDSLWAIAQKFDTSVSQLKTVNNLANDIIYPNQVIETEGGKTQSSTKPTTTKPSTTKSSTYTVKSGDTLSAIAFKHNVSIADLMKWNNLDSTLIYPGNVFVVTKNGSSSGASAGSGSNAGADTNTGGNTSSNSGTSSDAQVGSSTVYTVKSGDTLSAIASRNGVTVDNLKKWNNLKSDLIYIGQKLNIGSNAGNGTVDKDTSENVSSGGSSSVGVDYDVSKLISTAKSMNGVGYAWGGSSPSGFDCSGFIYYTFNKAGKSIGRLSSEGYYNRSFYVNKPAVGDLVFFENTYKSGISHLGIYLGSGQFIHAGSDGVQISSVSNPYWKKHFEGYKRFY
ncbi:C40 family peptidase [Lentibacillus sp. Marseille-P4043]|uniref:C40 family peptidase n=1 Tax=Lentibacillus sp. Marseille-P4043 TaxID=2040293 RepID=UPI000D0B3019|nr:peptidoglycan endopeptidase [Lentibacillus sp. Marseille-P4043]